MISKKYLLQITTAALLSLSLASYANQAVEAEVKVTAAAPAANTNLLDPGYWMTAFTGPTPPAISNGLTFNAAQPSAWMNWIDPKTHIPTHMTFMNPASYTQFMQPQFYLEFMKPENMAAWMNPASYQVMMNPQTVSYWMNPASYQHMADPAMYRETMNPANYMVYLNPNTYAKIFAAQTCDQQSGDKTSGWFGFGC
ncbi:MAG: hypothetical protein WBO58_16160 [Gammaproteobacteria bacterium]